MAVVAVCDGRLAQDFGVAVCAQSALVLGCAPLEPTLDASHPFSLVPEPLPAALVARGFSALTDVQRALLAADAQDRDLRISSQTGSGKTVALGFLLAHDLLDRAPNAGPRALVITPTRELANQVRDELAWLLHAVPHGDVAVVTGGTSVRREQERLARAPGIVVGTPGRLLDHLRSGALSGGEVAQVVLDEADRMLDMGFRDELEGVLDHLPETRRTHLVSATFPPAVQRLATRYQRDPLAIEGTRLGAANADIEHVGHIVTSDQRYDALINVLLAAVGARTLVFVRTRVAATELAEALTGDGFAVQALSGDLAQVQRQRTVEAFRAGTARVLVATDVAARGLDIPEIAVVVHFDGPEDIDAYTHRSGRTGRAGRQGRSVLLVPPAARGRATALVRAAGAALRWEPAPTPEIVRVAADTELRRALASRLEAELAPALLARAEELLAELPATALVAALLAEARAHGPCAARELAPLPDARRGDRNRPGLAIAPTTAISRGPDRSPRERPGASAFAEFYLNWGARHGATPPRVLALACRRGRVPSGAIGAIRVAPHATTIEISAPVASRFAKAANEPDAIDPRLRFAPLRHRRPAEPRSPVC
ncbi:MAG: DEAD/DEAH box helicase [Polyangiaceae bacterium]|nr:DEAD/DEAH box helicase [Polyangiaceae bacterium]